MVSEAFLNKLQKGQILKARVEEVQSSGDLLCNFQGDLLLIANHTGQSFHQGDPVRLQVVSTLPLQFRIFTSGPNNHFTRVA